MTAARLFAAFELPTPVVQHLAEMIHRLQAAAPRGSVRWVRPEGIHLTLKFYGEVDARRAPDIQALLAQATRSMAPLTLRLEGLGGFPNLMRPRVVWVGVQGDLEALGRLQKAIETGSRTLGFEPERRGFNPHLTLGRVNQPLRPPEQRELAGALAQARPPVSDPFRLEALSLMKSDLKPSGAVYTRLFAAPFGAR